MISISLDIDWASDEVLEYCLQIFDDFNVKVTFFATHNSPLIKRLEHDGHEVGIHPNFMPHLLGQGPHYTQVIDNMIEIFPHARGVRFHSLATAAPVLDYCLKKGILYDSSLYLPFQATPFKEYTGIKRIPFIKSDLQIVIDKSEFVHNMSHYDKTLPYIYIFHPVHIFLNTHALSDYHEAKKYYKDHCNLATYRNDSVPGVENLLRDVLQSHKPQDFVKMRRIYDNFT